MELGIGIIGAGLQGKRRASAIAEVDDAKLIAVQSLKEEDAQALAQPHGADVESDWKTLVQRDDIDVVFVCTPPHVHAEMTIAAMQAGKHVLCEKPLSRTLNESKEMLSVAAESGKILKVGFNHRHHPAIWEAKKLLDEGSLGAPLFARCRYGICGRPGYEKEWRADPKQAAGGQFIEQGTHAIDLFRWFLGDISQASCMTANRYFDEQELEDNGMAMFRFESGATAVMHTSFTEWKNLFSFEVFTENGYLQIDGLGGSYGVETLTVGTRDFFGPFKTTQTEFRRGDISWKEEWKEFADAIRNNRTPIGNANDGAKAMIIGLTAYEAEKQSKVLDIPEL